MKKGDIVRLKQQNTMYSNKDGVVQVTSETHVWVQFEGSKRTLKFNKNEVESRN